MTSYEEWFMNLRTPKRPSVVETGDDSTHASTLEMWPLTIMRTRLHQGRTTCPKNHKEFGLDWPNCQARNESTIQLGRLPHQE